MSFTYATIEVRTDDKRMMWSLAALLEAQIERWENWLMRGVFPEDEAEEVKQCLKEDRLALMTLRGLIRLWDGE